MAFTRSHLVHLCWLFLFSSGDGFIDDDSVCVFELNPGLSYASTSSPVILTIGDACGETRGFWTKDFLTSCYLCNKLLHGLDIFMYRGEKAFCSEECREIQIKIDECKEKCGWEGRKLAHDCSASPCSSPPVFVAEVAAA